MSQNDSNPGCIIAFIWIATIAISIISGILAWRWVEPESFIGGVGFIIVWGILSYALKFVISSIAYAIFNR